MFYPLKYIGISYSKVKNYLITVSAAILITASCFAADLGTFADYSEVTANVSFADSKKHIDKKILKMIDLAETDHIQLLEWAMSRYKKNIRDYSAVLHKQERIKGKLRPPQEIAVWFKEAPFSLVMKWRKNPVVVDKLLYVEKNEENNHMYVHPTGIFSWIKSVEKQPHCKEAISNGLRTCDQFGFYRSMQILEDMYKSVPQQKIKTKYLGPSKVFDRNSIAMASFIPKSKNYPDKVIIMQFDTQTLLPVGLSLYNKNKKLRCKYFFSDLKINIGIRDRFFTKKAHGM